MSKNKINMPDVVIIGGGPAGMSAALVAGRAIIQTVLINAETPRNMVTTASHGFLTRDGVHPLELMKTAKEQLKKYGTVSYKKGVATDVDKLENGFRVSVDDGSTFETANVIFATGYQEDVSKSNIPGIANVYGKSVYPCTFCDGWEHHGQKLALFDQSEYALEYAKIVAHWSKDLIIFTNGTQAIPQDHKQLLEKVGVLVVEDPISELISNENGMLQSVKLENGRIIAREAGFLFDTYDEPASNLPEKLGVQIKVNDWGGKMLDVGEAGQTNVEGIYIVGDAKTGFSGLVSAAFDGSACMEAIVHKKAATDWQAIVG